MTNTPSAPSPSPVRLREHWRDLIRVEADDRSTLERAAGVLTAAGYLLAPPPHGTNPVRCAFWCDDDGLGISTRTLQRVLIRNGVPAVIASTTLPTPAEAAADEAAWQREMAEMEAEAQATVEAESQRPAPVDGAPF